MIKDEFSNEMINRKGDGSINGMVVGGATYIVYYLDVQYPGCEHDSTIFRASKLYKKLEQGYRPVEGALLAGDSGYEVNPQKFKRGHALWSNKWNQQNSNSIF